MHFDRVTHKVVCSLFQFHSYSSASIAQLIIHILSTHTRMLSTQNLAIRNRRVDEVPPEAGDFARIINGSLFSLMKANTGRNISVNILVPPGVVVVHFRLALGVTTLRVKPEYRYPMLVLTLYLCLVAYLFCYLNFHLRLHSSFVSGCVSCSRVSCRVLFVAFI